MRGGLRSYVLATYPNLHGFGKSKPPNKFLTIKRGPFKVISALEGGHYKVQVLAHEDSFEEIHVKELHPFVFNATYTDPFEVSLGDNQEFYVEEIVRHEKRPNYIPIRK